MPRLESKMVIVVVVFFRRFLLSVHIDIFLRIMCWNCAVVSRSFPFFPHAQLTGESKYDEKWKELTKMLNNTLGPKKTVEEWKMVKSFAFKNIKMHFIVMIIMILWVSFLLILGLLQLEKSVTHSCEKTKTDSRWKDGSWW